MFAVITSLVASTMSSSTSTRGEVQVPVPVHEVQVQVQEVQVPVQVKSTIAQNFIIFNISQKSLVSLKCTE